MMSAKHRQHRLTNDEIHDIRMLRGVEPARVTARRYDRTQSVISSIQRGYSYRCVPFTPAEIELSRLALVGVGGRAALNQPGEPR